MGEGTSRVSDLERHWMHSVHLICATLFSHGGLQNMKYGTGGPVRWPWGVHPIWGRRQRSDAGHLPKYAVPSNNSHQAKCGKPGRRRCGWASVVAKRAISAISRRPASSAMAMSVNTGPIRWRVFFSRGSGACRKTSSSEPICSALTGNAPVGGAGNPARQSSGTCTARSRWRASTAIGRNHNHFGRSLERWKLARWRL